MREPVRDKGRLEHILSAISNIEEFVEGFSQEQLLADKLRLHAVAYNVQIIGEATYRCASVERTDKIIYLHPKLL